MARTIVAKKAGRTATAKPVASPAGNAKPKARKPGKPDTNRTTPGDPGGNSRIRVRRRSRRSSPSPTRPAGSGYETSSS